MINTLNILVNISQVFFSIPPFSILTEILHFNSNLPFFATKNIHHTHFLHAVKYSYAT